MFLLSNVPRAWCDHDGSFRDLPQSPALPDGRMGGVVPFTEEILHEIERIASSELNLNTNPRDAWLERMAEA